MKITKLFFTVVLISISFSGFTQSYKYLSKKRFSVGVSFSPDYTYRTLKSNVDNNGFIDMRNETETARFGFTTFT